MVDFLSFIIFVGYFVCLRKWLSASRWDRSSWIGNNRHLPQRQRSWKGAQAGCASGIQIARVVGKLNSCCLWYKARYTFCNWNTTKLAQIRLLLICFSHQYFNIWIMYVVYMLNDYSCRVGHRHKSGHPLTVHISINTNAHSIRRPIFLLSWPSSWVSLYARSCPNCLRRMQPPCVPVKFPFAICADARPSRKSIVR